MKFLFLAVAVCMLAYSAALPADKYTDRFDNVNLDEILASDRLLNKYVDCLLDKGRCTPDAKALKDNLPDALSHNCSKCTKTQKDSSTKVIRHFVNKRPDLWRQLEGKYDPQGIYAEKYRDVINKAKN